jgi:hypothetical protein
MVAEVAFDETGWVGTICQDRRSSNVWTLAYVGASAEAFGRWIYEAAQPGLFLPRKRKIFDDYIRIFCHMSGFMQSPGPAVAGTIRRA